MDRFSPEPIEPGTPLKPRMVQLLLEWRSSPRRLRATLSVYLSLAAVGCLYGGYAISVGVPGLASWLCTLLILEPLGIACLLAVTFLYVPNRVLGNLLAAVSSARRFC
jgi:hypothetical protein